MTIITSAGWLRRAIQEPGSRQGTSWIIAPDLHMKFEIMLDEDDEYVQVIQAKIRKDMAD